jgi:outer membrane protein assembly factor BamB
MPSPSRRDVLAAGGGLFAGLAGGYVARPHLTSDDAPDPAPFAWVDTEWPYPDYDPGRTRNPPAESAPAADLTEQWRHEVYSGEPPAVVASNGRVVVGSPYADSGHVECLDAQSGDEQWSVAAGNSLGTPVAAPGDRVFSRTPRGDGFASWAAATGERFWATTTGDASQLFLGSGRQHLLYRDGHTVRVRTLNARTGDGLWRTTVELNGHFPAAAYVPSEDSLFVGMGGGVARLDGDDGATVWREPVDSNGFTSGPVVAGGRVFRAGFQRGVGAFDAAPGARLWDALFDEALANAEDPQVARYYDVGAATGDALLAVERHGDDRAEQLVAFDAASGDRLWRTEFGGEASVSQPTPVGDTVYASVGTEQRQRLVAFDLADGSETAAWPLPTYGGAPVVADGWVFVPTYDAVVALH